ncbi:MAG: phosphate ABC transporter substrate-binding protein [Nitrospirota bacterium]
MKKKWVPILFFMLLSLCLFVCACRREESNITRTIKVAGSTTVLPAISNGAESFMRAYPDVIITINAGGSGVGITSVANGLADIGMASRDISGEEKKNFPHVDFRVYAIGKDAVACVVSSEIYNAGIMSLSKETIRNIYLGKIKNWKEIGGPDKDILVIDKEFHRGTRHVFMEYIFGDENAKAPGADIVTGSNNEEQTKLGQSDSAIGMLSYAWINKDVVGIGIAVDGKVIEPIIENIKNGSYPIVRNLLLVTRGEPSGAVKEFIDFILSQRGQRIVEEAGYVPIKAD